MVTLRLGSRAMKRDASMVASDPDISAWVAANAGAGKTYTLANRVARLLLADAKPQKILCLTFTKAAAAEMQERLFRQLGEWAMLPDEDLRDRIITIGGEAHTALAKARRLFAGALETPGGVKVLTLHAFCQILLSRFPLEAKIPPAFDVLDDQTAQEMIAEPRQRVLERAGSGDAALGDAVARLVTETSEATLNGLLEAAVGGDRRKLDRYFARVKDFAAAVRGQHDLAEGEDEDGIAGGFCAELTREIAQLRAAQGWLAAGGKTDGEIAGHLAITIADINNGFVTMGRALLTGAGEPRKRLAPKALADARPDLLNYMIALQERYCAAAERRKAARAAALTQAALTVIDEMRDDYYLAKRLRGVLDYDDLIIETRKLLTRRGAAQWVLYKLDGGIDHVLIDEAQDTSPEQWEIVKKLTEEFFVGLGRERGRRTIIAVGDEKQSIFSFQGADPAQFDINRRYFSVAIAGAQQFLQDVPLIASRRSAPD